MSTEQRRNALGIPQNLPFRFDLTKEGCHARRAKLLSKLDPRADAVILGGADHISYFANLFVPHYIFQANDASAYLILTNETCILVHDNLIEHLAASAHVDEHRCVTWYRGLETAGDRLGLVLDETHKILEKLK